MRSSHRGHSTAHPLTILATFLLAVTVLAVVPPAASAQTPPSNDNFAAALLLDTDSGSLVDETNVDSSVEPGEPVHAGYGPSRSVWYEWTPSIDGNAVLELTTPTSPDDWRSVLAVYTGASVDALTEVASAVFFFSGIHQLELRVVAGTTYHLAVAGHDTDETGTFDLSWAIPSPLNDDFVSATVMVDDDGSMLTQTNEWATIESGEPAHAGYGPSRSVWYEWTPSMDGHTVVEITTPTSPDDWRSVLAVYTGASVDALTEVASAVFTFSGIHQLGFRVVAGTTYHLAVDGHDANEAGTFDIGWAADLDPSNDGFAAATVLVNDIGPVMNDVGSLVGETNEWATAEAGEPSHNGLAGTPAASVWYKWTPSADGEATLKLTTPTFPDNWGNVLAVYTGTTVDSLTEVVSTSSGSSVALLTFPVLGGTIYHLAVDGHDADQTGAFDLTWSVLPDEGHFVVTKTEDTDDGCDADCSLREAVIAANTTPGDDTIELPAGSYVLTVKGSPGVNVSYGDLDIEREMGTTSILGAGRDTTVIDASGLQTSPGYSQDRVITVHYHAGLNLTGVTITGGYTNNPGINLHGGGIWNWNGNLTVTDCIIEGNVAGENGGGIANSYGTATVTNTIIRDNNTDPPEYSTTGNGGGIYNTGTMTIVDSTIELNGSDFGGGIANENYLGATPGILDIENSVVVDNEAWRGGGIANHDEGTMTITGGTVSGNEAARGFGTVVGSNRGGGIWNAYGGVLTVNDATIQDNQVMASDGFHPVDGGGGGIANQWATLEMHGTTVSNNTSLCDDIFPGDPDLCGRGGGVVNAGGYATITNSTISGNTTTAPNSLQSPYLGGAGGGGVAHMPHCVAPYCYCPVTVLDSVTITSNTADHGGGINAYWESWGAGIYDVAAWAVGDGYECPDLYVTNTIVADNTATYTAGTEDCWGDYTSEGFNLVGADTGCPVDGPGDLPTVSPLLGSLADNGGTTETHSLLAGSPALDTGATDLPVDQRGASRPQGIADDIGAFEATDALAPTVTVTEPVPLSTVELPVTASGTATDNMGVAEVRVEIYNRDTLKWWNGTAWQTARTHNTAILDTPGGLSTGWDYVFDPPTAAFLPYWMTIRSVDTSNNLSDRQNINFTGTLGDTELPTVTVTEPVPLSTVELPVTASGTATDNMGVAEVRVEIYNRDTLEWWNGTAWQTARTHNTAILDTPGGLSTGWTYLFDPPTAATLPYWMTIRSVDTSNNLSNRQNTNFTGTLGDTELPTVTVTEPIPLSTVELPVTASGTASDNIGVAEVRVEIYNRDTLEWWNGTAWQPARTHNTAILDTPGGLSTGWTYLFDPPTAATLPYWMTIRSVDTSNNLSNRQNTNFTGTLGDTELPTVTVTEPIPLSTVELPVTASGTATDNIGVAEVRVEIYNRDTLEWWNGTDWQPARTHNTATLDTPGGLSTGWTYLFDPPTAAFLPYWMTIRSIDTSNNLSNRQNINFTGTLGDTELPTVTVTEPIPLSTVELPVTASGTATDNIGVAEVRVEIYNRDTLEWWNGTDWQTARTHNTAILDTPGGLSTGWTYVFDPPTAAFLPYWMTIRSVDTSNNLSDRQYINFTGT